MTWITKASDGTPRGMPWGGPYFGPGLEAEVLKVFCSRGHCRGLEASLRQRRMSRSSGWWRRSNTRGSLWYLGFSLKSVHDFFFFFSLRVAFVGSSLSLCLSLYRITVYTRNQQQNNNNAAVRACVCLWGRWQLGSANPVSKGRPDGVISGPTLTYISVLTHTSHTAKFCLHMECLHSFRTALFLTKTCGSPQQHFILILFMTWVFGSATSSVFCYDYYY